MTYRNIMVWLDALGENEAILGLTARLAHRFGARVIGIAAACPFPITITDSLAATVVASVSLERESVAQDMEACQAQFRAAMKGWTTKVEWRSTLNADSIVDYVAQEARAADLIIINRNDDHRSQGMNVGALTIRAGRPILVVPRGIRELRADRIAVAWNDSREARRAVSDAMPFLREASSCALLEVTSLDGIAASKDRLEDVAGWLTSHGVGSEVRPVGASGSQSLFLTDELRMYGPDLVVAGAYGHKRLTEWAFGGVTCDILLKSNFCVFISH